jgi:ABC-type molybdate transport system ATPase subunit
LATALVASPMAILVDETFSNVHGRDEFIATFGRLAREAKSDLLFTSQDAADGRLAEHLYVMDNGSARLVEPQSQ